MKNVKMDYLYRDAGNYKLRSSVVFKNHYNLTIRQICDLIAVAFIDKGWFNPDLCEIPKLTFDAFDTNADHNWYEVEIVSLTELTETLKIDISDFLSLALKVHQRYKLNVCPLTEQIFNL